MMRQYHRLRAENPGAILFFRLGDFYEMFFEDAKLAAPILDITLTARGRGTANEAPMCGVPYHSADTYLARLLRAGHKVAIAEQVEGSAESTDSTGSRATKAARSGKGMVRREVVRVLSPGTLTDDELLPGRDNNYLVAVMRRGEAGHRDERIGAAALDLSTGEFTAAQFEGREAMLSAREEIARWAPLEVCFPNGQDAEAWIADRPQALRGVDSSTPDPATVAGGGTTDAAASVATWSPLEPWTFDPGRARARLCEHFGVSSLDGFDLAEQDAAVGAAGALLQYAIDNSHTAALRHVRSIRRQHDRSFLELDAVTRRSLELVESWQDGQRAGSLLSVIDRTATPMGARRIKQWLLRPLRLASAIERRQSVVAGLVEDLRTRDRMREALRRVADIERLTTRVSLGTASPRDLGALRDSLQALPEVRESLLELGQLPMCNELYEAMDPCVDVMELISRQLVDEPPAVLGSSGAIRGGFDAALDRLRQASRSGKEFIAGLESTERAATGISSLKVGFNKVFGYYLEASKANLDKVPGSYIRKQTLSNAERYITPELKEFEQTVLGAEEKIAALEREIFARLRDEIAENGARLLATAAAVASLDALASLAEVGALGGYRRPLVDDGVMIEIRGGRHPTVEALQPGLPFVPNDTYLDGDAHRIKLVTGPNMGGKSTYLRQLALIVVLAQMGGFVPAEAARIGVADRIFTRVGASDNLARGISTFLAEMQETASILNNATERSLVLLDEVGRGTSTYDGLAIAWAVVEYLRDDADVRPRTLFATHYHELTELAVQGGSVGNLRVAVQESGADVVFLHRVEPGAADRSYGIHVARLAGLPAAVVARAEEVLNGFEGPDGGLPSARGPISGVGARGNAPIDGQIPLFVVQRPGQRTSGEDEQMEPTEHAVIGRLRQLDLDDLTPLEALNLLAELRAAADEEND